MELVLVKDAKLQALKPSNLHSSAEQAQQIHTVSPQLQFEDSRSKDKRGGHALLPQLKAV